MAYLKLMHLFAVLVWVGGMFFAYLVLRPSAAEVLQPPERMRLWGSVLSSFFNWVWLAIAMLLASGSGMIYLLGGIAQVSGYVHFMLTLGLSMMGIFVYVFFVYYARFRHQVREQDWPKAGGVLASIRRLVGLNLMLGLSVVVVVVLGTE